MRNPTFITPKKNRIIIFLSNFMKLNQRIRRKPFPFPKIQDMLLNLESFTYASSLDLNMEYHHIDLSPGDKQFCTIVLHWGKYEYQKLLIGACKSPKFSKKICPKYLKDSTWYVHILMEYYLLLGFTLSTIKIFRHNSTKTRGSGIKRKFIKSFFGWTETEYICF